MHRGRLRQGPVVGLAAVVLAALVAQIAVAGGAGEPEATITISKAELKELIRQEVAKRASARAAKKKKAKPGPAGPAGPQGPQGIQGVPGSDGVPGGASLGVASGPGTPPATANRSLAEVFIDLPQPAKVFVTGHTTASVTCSAAGTCSSRIGLYVDSSANPITNSEYDVDSTASTTVTRDGSLVGVTGTLPAGGYSLKMFSTDVGNVANISYMNSSIAAISLTG